MDGTLKIWDYRNYICEKNLNEHTKAIICIDYSPCGKKIASGSYDKTIKIWDLNFYHCESTID